MAMYLATINQPTWHSYISKIEKMSVLGCLNVLWAVKMEFETFCEKIKVRF
jgi:hypothetical protein